MKEIAVVVLKVKIGKVTHELSHDEIIKLRDALNNVTGYDRPYRYHCPWSYTSQMYGPAYARNATLQAYAQNAMKAEDSITTDTIVVRAE